MNELWNGFKVGCVEAWRGYFAPLRWSPWRAALNAGQRPGSRWFSPFTAWCNEIERIVVGDAPK